MAGGCGGFSCRWWWVAVVLRSVAGGWSENRCQRINVKVGCRWVVGESMPENRCRICLDFK
ncbi:hypothetical protein HanRHA438_Chr02g0057161 [Helianthus annuus]|nr:hypothetical protein HanRHA438_Chr02g0057161 [Helianthus annuus]